MTKPILIMNGIILFYLIQRLSEVFISKTNEKWLYLHHHALEVDKKESAQMRVFHSLWFVSLILEANLKQELQQPLYALIIYCILGLCLIIRLHSMEKLKAFWTIKVLSLENPVISTSGLYQYVRHPNYFIVMIELLCIPLLFKAYWTMGIFSFINFFILARRIKAEESSLMKHSAYRIHFEEKKRFIPFIFMLCLAVLPLHAKEKVFQTPNYNEAKKNESFLKFQSTSTKLGLISTNFDGYAKDFKINYQLEQDHLKDLEVSVAVKSLDTDVGSRDDKMHNQIMDAEKYPELKASYTGPVELTEGTQTINMIFTIKDKKVSRPVTFTVSKKDSKILVNGSAKLGLQEMGLPDPSIMIAKVRDLFDIEFNVVLD
ncbi:isoprenylcysteine carboxylmethyltransferase family protein [Bacteriovorax stolpii]|uniref:isoprenylcysteine carboxylmethyltransferase family protein n=1 Tax=Bacteriovorax stolpii TaxID=960 RepID=UPI00163B973C|nr:isoprenylcysteine carboxylmethyltransferase family protein [Bacteriovorax stolpii]